MAQQTVDAVAQGGTVSHAVVTAVADLTDAEPWSLDPLFRTIDPDALDRLFSPAEAIDRSPERLEFTYSGCDVVVSADGTVRASQQDREIAKDWLKQ